MHHRLILSIEDFPFQRDSVRNTLVSSANMIGSNKFDAFFRSFTYSKNSSGLVLNLAEHHM